jgi:hypothetical protein
MLILSRGRDGFERNIRNEQAAAAGRRAGALRHSNTFANYLMRRRVITTATVGMGLDLIAKAPILSGFESCCPDQ